MIYRKKSELVTDQIINRVIETPNHLIIDGYLYDKKTLTRIPSEKIVVMNGSNIHCHGINVRYHTTTNENGREEHYVYNFLTNEFYNLRDEYGIARSNGMWVDQDDPSVEWVHTGNSIIKIDRSHNVIDQFPLNFGSAIPCASMALGQDSQYLYGVASFSQLDGQNYSLRLYSFDKQSLQLYLQNYYDIKYISAFQILHRTKMLNGVFCNILQYDKNIIYYYLLRNGDIVEKEKRLNLYNRSAATGNLGKTKFGKNDLTLFLTTDGGGCANFRVLQSSENNYVDFVQLIDGIDIKNDTSRLKNVSALIKSKYSYDATVQNYNERQLRERFFYAKGDIGFEGHVVYELEEPDTHKKFIVAATRPSRFYPLNNYSRYRWISVWRIENPEEISPTMTLTDYYSYELLDNFVDNQNQLSGFDKVGKNLIIQTLDTYGMRLYSVTKEGKLKWDTIYWNNLVDIGFDEFGRLYITDRMSSEVHIYTERLPTKLFINYENGYPDASFEIDITKPVLKKILISSKNIYGRYVPATYKLTISGDAEFVSSKSKIVQGKTNTSGKGSEMIQITGPSDAVVITKQIVYNNELVIP